MKEIISNKELEIILRNVGLSNEEMKRLFKSKLLEKVFKALLLINELLIEKNLQLETLTNDILMMKEKEHRQKETENTLNSKLVSLQYIIEDLRKETGDFNENFNNDCIENSMVLIKPNFLVQQRIFFRN